MKAGYKTTEFWLTVVVVILSVAVTSGYISQAEAQELTDKLAQVLNSGADFVSALVLVIVPSVYVWSRTRVKQK